MDDHKDGGLGDGVLVIRQAHLIHPAGKKEQHADNGEVSKELNQPRFNRAFHTENDTT